MSYEFPYVVEDEDTLMKSLYGEKATLKASTLKEKAIESVLAKMSPEKAQTTQALRAELSGIMRNIGDPLYRLEIGEDAHAELLERAEEVNYALEDFYQKVGETFVHLASVALNSPASLNFDPKI